MFEALIARGEALARARAARSRDALAGRIQAAGVQAEADEDGVRLRGPGLRLRFALEPTLRWFREWSR